MKAYIKNSNDTKDYYVLMVFFDFLCLITIVIGVHFFGVSLNCGCDIIIASSPDSPKKSALEKKCSSGGPGKIYHVRVDRRWTGAWAYKVVHTITA